MGHQLALAPAWAEDFTWATQGNMRIDGDAEQFAIKFYPTTTSAITHVDLDVNVNSPTGVLWVAEIQSDSSDAPSGSVLGAATAEFAISADGFQGSQALGSNTGALTLNTPYWLVFRRSSGTSLSASVWAQPSRVFTQSVFGSEKMRHYNGADWTTTTAVVGVGSYALTHASGALTGFPVTSLYATSAEADIFGTNRQALRIRVGSQTVVRGVRYRMTKTGSPSDLVAAIYEGATQKATQTIPAGHIVGNVAGSVLFASPPTIAAAADLSIVFRQAADGGDNSNDYNVRTASIHAAHISALVPTHWRFTVGTGDDPTAYTAQTDEFPYIFPIVTDPSVDFIESAGGGGRRRRLVTVS